MTEVEKTIAFVREQHAHAANRRRWKRRLANFGFAIEPSDHGPVITALPDRAVICPLPLDLRA